MSGIEGNVEVLDMVGRCYEFCSLINGEYCRLYVFEWELG